MSEQMLYINFVNEIEKYDCLYNYNLGEYSRKDITEKAWAKVGEVFSITSQGTVGNIPTNVNFEEGDISIEMPPEEQDHYLENSPPKPPKRIKKRQIENNDVDKTFISYLEAKKSKYEKNETPENDSNKLFLLSLQSELSEMSKTQLRTLKIEVMQLIDRITMVDTDHEYCYDYIETLDD